MSGLCSLFANLASESLGTSWRKRLARTARISPKSIGITIVNGCEQLLAADLALGKIVEGGYNGKRRRVRGL